MKQPDKAELEKKAWYRLLKVVYIACLITSVLFGVLIGSLSTPQEFVKDVLLICSNGQTLSLKAYDIYFDRFTGRVPSSYRLADRCPERSPNSRQHELKNIYETEGNWLTAIGSGLAVVIISSLLITLIKKVFLYILVGQKIL